MPWSAIPACASLAANPLLLTILALMKRQGVLLPERRVQLYDQYVQTLLRHWNLSRGLDRRVARDLDVLETMRVLAPLALWMHETNPGVGLVKGQRMRRRLEEIYSERHVASPQEAAQQLLRDARDHASLLLERGHGEYGFIHLTFQEYLAAMAIAQRGQSDLTPVVDLLASHIEDAAWHEVSLLTIGYMGIVQQRDEAAGQVLARADEKAGRAAGRGGRTGRRVGARYVAGRGDAAVPRRCGSCLAADDDRQRQLSRRRSGHAPAHWSARWATRAISMRWSWCRPARS